MGTTEKARKSIESELKKMSYKERKELRKLLNDDLLSKSESGSYNILPADTIGNRVHSNYRIRT